MDIFLKNDQHFWHFVTSATYGFLIVAMLAVLANTGRLPQSVPILDFLMLILATFRITRLIVHDMVADFIRDAFSTYEKGLGKSIRDLINCPWCTGIWAGAFVTFFYFLTPFAWPFILILSIAAAGSIINVVVSIMMVKLNGK